MNIILLCIGKTQTDYLQRGIAEYVQRLSNYTSFSIHECAAVKNAKSMSKEELMRREAKVFLDFIQPNDRVFVLDERGTQPSSRAFSQLIQTELNAGRKRCVFVVGGPFGCSEELMQRADKRISLSSMTLTHDMVRLLFVEQLYRAFSILNGEKYHHD